MSTEHAYSIDNPKEQKFGMSQIDILNFSGWTLEQLNIIKLTIQIPYHATLSASGYTVRIFARTSIIEDIWYDLIELMDIITPLFSDYSRGKNN